jgi:hypothetical protein
MMKNSKIAKAMTDAESFGFEFDHANSGHYKFRSGRCVLVWDSTANTNSWSFTANGWGESAADAIKDAAAGTIKLMPAESERPDIAR